MFVLKGAPLHLARGAVLAAWGLGVAAWFVPALAGQRWIAPTLVGIHALECFAFLPILRKSGRDGNSDLPLLMLFGAVHFLSLDRTPADRGAPEPS
ncbi:MAG: hypothetical protein KC766_35345 [Myxococcales bacterium]|nr:hypothetical protein [Myxococcales bacterium]